MSLMTTCCRLLIFVSAFFLGVRATSAQLMFSFPSGNSFIVNSPADEWDAAPGDGLCRTPTGACTLRAAVQEANARPSAGPYTIQLPANTYTLIRAGTNEDNAFTGDLDLRANIEIIGADRNTTIIWGAGLDRVFHVLPGATVTLRNLEVSGGLALMGGGIYNEQGGRLVLIKCSVSSNNAEFAGGGIANAGVLEVDTSRIATNHAWPVWTSQPQGGGIYHFGGNLIVTRSTFYGNSARWGAGLFLQEGNNTISNSSVVLNLASQGGAIELTGTSSLTMMNSTISSNGGSAIRAFLGNYSGSGSVRLISSTVTGNTAGLQVFEGLVYLRATILNQGATGCLVNHPGRAQIVSLGYNIDRGFSCQFNGSTDQSGVDPLLGPLAYNGGPTDTHILLPGSPALDRIPALDLASFIGNVPNVDQRGVARPQYQCSSLCYVTPSTPSYDVGAYEAPPLPQPVLSPIF
jgi:CSLREA domain-containing protein